MLKGDLSATPLSDVLRALADQAVTGCLHIDDEAGDEALVYLKAGQVYAAYVPGRRPQLGARLISSGALAPEALAEALEAQETELQGWRLGELLVHLGYVDRAVVEAFVLEQLREATFDLSRWPSGRFRFRKNEKTRGDVGLEASVADLLAEVDRRRSEWDVIGGVVHGPGAVPVLSAGGIASAEMTLDQDQWALLCKVDGERSIAQLARDCGFTTFEAGQIVYALVGAGLLDVEETVFDAVSSSFDEPGEPVVDEDFAPLGAALASAFAAPAEAEPEAPAEEPALQTNDLTSELASLTAALADLPSLSMPTSLEPDFPAPTPVAEEAPVAEPVAEAPVEPVTEPVAEEPVATPVADDPFGDSLARVSEALNALLGDALPPVAMREPPKEPEPSPEELAAAKAEQERLERSRAAAAAELAEAHRMAEAARQEKHGLRGVLRRRSSSADDAARAEAERLDVEEAARVDAERVEAERLAAEEAARVEAGRVAAEEAARAEAERIEAERLAAEEAARAEAERIEAERLAAEEAARVEAERLAAEEAARLEAERAEAERVAAEEAVRAEAEEAARAEAERLAAEEAERLADEQARAEVDRLAAEETARSEADRFAAEVAEAAEAEEAARVEAERAAAAEQAERESPPAAAFEVASLLRDFNDDPPADTVETVEEFTPEPEPEPAYAANGNQRAYGETAALLRELTSLGLDDDEPQSPAANAASSAGTAKQSTPPKEQPKKRKGLFGRS